MTGRRSNTPARPKRTASAKRSASGVSGVAPDSSCLLIACSQKPCPQDKSSAGRRPGPPQRSRSNTASPKDIAALQEARTGELKDNHPRYWPRMLRWFLAGAIYARLRARKKTITTRELLNLVKAATGLRGPAAADAGPDPPAANQPRSREAAHEELVTMVRDLYGVDLPESEHARWVPDAPAPPDGPAVDEGSAPRHPQPR